ncbi:aminoglycoside phosphotransferase family protein [Lacisediminihabitans sp.]|uniref:aminoglycoside phosphotransferase family protein n=1 Tax=Lacisediminihabitans sp. TaxID=2787631 RepID=UPI00374D4E21
MDHDGWDNRTFRVGDTLAARLPSAAGYVPQVRKEVAWLPLLAAGVTLPIPEVVALGEPGHGYPFEWTMRRWIDGTPAAVASGLDLATFARDLAAFLVELRGVDPSAGPRPGAHSAGRGAGLDQWDAETRAAIRALGDDIDGGAALEEWERALGSPGGEPGVWFHGDVAAGNLLVADGRLSAVIDFGCAGVGDPACDLAIAWTLLDESSRLVLRHGLDADDALWERARGWALWKALITADDPLRADEAARVLSALGIATRPRAR